MPRPIVATIDRSALTANLLRVRRLCKKARIYAVVKADAYGHGLATALEAFASADGIALVEIERAIEARERGWRGPILLLEGCFSPLDWQAASEHRLEVVVHCEEQLAMLEATALSRRIGVHVKVNSGMNRLGFPCARVRDVVRQLTVNAAVSDIVLMTHFARADEPDGYVEQLRRFREATAGLPYPCSLANSAACFDFDRVGGEFVRPGIMLYGATPFAQPERSAAALGLRPAMRLTTQVIAIQSIGPGDAVGYGGTYVAKRAERIAIIAAGYADGYPRHAPTGTPVLVGGARARLVGRVSMDKIAADVTDLPLVTVGSEVELFGPNLPVDEVAQAAGTIGYQLLTAVAARVPRRVLG
ncbi:MAG: alanine racemase [Casimicrobiaceae bacterium]|nr:alanine racemase [Casimicrobiaceae bacterium]MDW8313175.1 alanine racemase [Burkholderiales bacterium]